MTEQSQSLIHIFRHRAQRYGPRVALYYKKNNSYRSISWHQWLEEVDGCALGLLSLGVQRGSRIAILSENRPEWTYADLGGMSLGCVIVPIYPTTSLEDFSHIIRNAGVEIIFLSSQAQWQRLRSLIQELSGIIKRVIVFDGGPGAENILTFDELIQLGKQNARTSQQVYAERMAEVKPDDLATLIYTSGTTGPPKGVMLTHRNFVANYLGAKEKIKIKEYDIALSFLPLSHVFERLAGYYFMAFNGARIAYAESMQTVVEDMVQIKPTVAAAVPRFYEKFYARVMEKVQAAPAGKARLFAWALKVGKNYSTAIQYKRRPSGWLWIQNALARSLVFSKIKAGLGGRIRFFISGGAPLSKEIAEFFHAMDILILEGYGLTETSPVIAVNSPEDLKFGTVGKPLRGCDVKIADDGEILTRGPCVMKGYYQNPEATQEVLRDGWFHTGDIGELDGEGFLKITDRKKDIIKTSGGKIIAPQNIENRILSDPLFSQIVVVGNKRNYVVALIVPFKERLMDLAKQRNLDHLPWEALLKHPEIMSAVEERLKIKVHGMASYEQIKYFALLPREFSLEAGEITPTLKIRRRVVEERYKTIIDTLYASSATPGISSD